MSQDENNIRAESAAQVELILQNLRDLVDYEEEQVDQVVLTEMISKFEALATSFKQINVGVYGYSGSGKSTLLNRILGCEILPAFSWGKSCTNTIFKIRKRVALGDKFEVVLHYFSLADISMMILPNANSNMEEEEEEDGRKEGEPTAVTLTAEILKAFWGQAVPESENLKELIPSKFYDILSRPEKRKEKHSFADADEAWDFIKEKTKEEGVPFLLKEIEVLGNFPGLHEQVCLLDIPGGGDTVFLRRIQLYGLEQSDLVIIVEQQPRVANGDVFERLTLPASYLTKKVGLAFCMTHVGKGYKEICLCATKRATKRAKTEVSKEVVDVEEIGRQYVDEQKKQFRDELRKFSSDLAEQLKGMEMFTLENDTEEKDKEPSFSQAEWEKFTTFLNQVVHKREVWDLIVANLHAAIEDAQARLKTPPITSLSKDCIAEIQAVFQSEEAEPINFVCPLEQDIPELNLSAVKSGTRYRATLKSAKAPDFITCYPDIPIWSHVVSSALNLPAITKSNLAFQMGYIQAIEKKLEKVKPVLEKYLGGNGGGNGGKVNFCLNRLRVFLVQRLNEDLESSTRMFKHGELEHCLTKAFWKHVPTVSTGKKMMAKNAQAIKTFLKDHFREMRDFLQEKVGRKVRTLDQSLARVCAELGDLHKWLQQQPSEDAQVRAGLELISIALKAEKKAESDQEEEASNSAPAGTPKAFRRKLRELDVELQALFPNDCKPLKGTRVRRPVHKPTVGWLYLASTTNPMDSSIFIGWDNAEPKQANLLGEALQSNYPQLCFRLMQRAFPPSGMSSANNTKLAKVIADKDVAASVARIVCEFVEKVYGEWGF